MRFSAVIKSGSILFFSAALFAADVETKIETDPFGQTNLVVSSPSGGRLEYAETPKCKGAGVFYGGAMHSINIVNGKMTKSFGLNFRIAPKAPGKYTVQPFAVMLDGQKVMTQRVEFSVRENDDPFAMLRDSPFASEDEDPNSVKGELSFRRKVYYPGELIILRYDIINKSGENLQMRGFSEPPVNNGFYSKELSGGAVESSGSTVKAFALVPTAGGNFSVGGARAVVTSRSAFSGDYEVEFAKADISVRNLPVPVPDDFCASAGKFTLSMETPSGNAKLYGEILVRIIVSGEGNFFTMKDPYVKYGENVKVSIKANEPEIEVVNDMTRGRKIYDVSIIPVALQPTGPISVSFSLLDPDSGKYYRLISDVPSFNVLPADENTEKSGEKKPSGISFFVIALVLVLVLMGAFTALVLVKKRRGFPALKIRSSASGPQNIAPARAETSDDSRASAICAKMRSVLLSRDTDALVKVICESFALLGNKDSLGHDFSAMKARIDAVRFGGEKTDYSVLEDMALKIMRELEKK